MASGLALAVGGEAASGFGGGPFGCGPGMEPLAVGNLAVGNALAEPGGGFGIMTPALAGIFDAALDIALAIGSLKWRLQHLFPTHPCWHWVIIGFVAGLCWTIIHCHRFSSQDSSYGTGSCCLDAAVYVVVLGGVGGCFWIGRGCCCAAGCASGLAVAGAVGVVAAAGMTLLGVAAEVAGNGGCGGGPGWAGRATGTGWPHSGSSGRALPVPNALVERVLVHG